MKRLIAALWLAALAGCVTHSGNVLTPDRVSGIQPGVTTRADLNEWFGDPFMVGADAEGRTMAVWHGSRLTSAPYYFDMRIQMLTAVFTNGVVFNFSVADQVNNPPTRPEPVEQSPTPKPKLHQQKGP